MAIASVGNLGTGVIGAAANTTFTVTTAAAIEAGNVALIAVGGNNVAATDGSGHNEVTSVTDSAGAVTWTKLGEYVNAEGGGPAGVTQAVFYRPRQGSELASASAITITLANSVTDWNASCWEFSCATDLTESAADVGNATDAAEGFGSAAFSGVSSVERLYFRGLVKEANVATTSQITPSAGFSAITAIRSRNHADSTCLRGEFIIATSTGETSNPTFAFSGDTAAVFVALHEGSVASTIPVKMNIYRQQRA